MPTYDPTSPYRPIFGSLSDQKAVNLANKYSEKKERLDPEAVQPDPLEATENALMDVGERTNEIDLMQASMLTAGGRLADTAREVSNKLFGTDFDFSREEGYSDQRTADEIAGVSLAYRKEYEEDLQKVAEQVAEGDVMGTIKAGGNVALRAAADSFATLPEVAAGTALTAMTGGVAGPLIFGKKIKGAVETAEKVKKAVSKAKEYKEATRLGKALLKSKDLPKIALKAAGQASILTADLQQQQAADYYAEHGEYPSPARRSFMVLGSMATTIVEPGIITHLFIPKFKKELWEEGRNLVKNLGKGSNLKSIGFRIGDALQKLAKAGAAEAGQEYIQTWHEIFAQDITSEQADDLWNAVASKVTDKDLRNQALTGGVIGGMAGGVTRGVVSAPAVAAGTAIDLTKATAKGTAKVAVKGIDIAAAVSQKAATKAGMAILSEEEQEAVRSDYENRKAVFDEKAAEINESIDKVAAAETYEDIIADEKIAKVAKEAQIELDLTDEDLQKPKALRKLKDKISRKYKATEEMLDLKLKASTVGQVGIKAGEGVKKGVVKTYKDVVESEQVAKAIKTVEKYGDAAVQAVKEIRSSTALGLIEMGIEGGKGSTKVIIEKAKKLNLADVQRVATAVGPKNPTLAKELDRLAKRKREFLKKAEQRTDELINEDTLSPVISEIAEKGTFDTKSAKGAATAIRKTLAGRIADRETLTKIKKAIAVYKQSDAYKNNEKGSIDETNMKVLENRLETTESRLGREEKVDTVTKAAKEAFKTVKESKIVKKGAEKIKAAVKAVDEFAEETADKIDKKISKVPREPKVLEEGVLKSKLENIGVAIAKGPEAAATVAKSIKNIARDIKKAGYETTEDLADLAKQLPFLAQNKEFYAKLESYFEPTEEIVAETDVVINKETKINEEEDASVSDNVIVNMYKKLTGCKS